MKKIVFVRYDGKESLAQAKKSAKLIQKEYEKIFGKSNVSVLVLPKNIEIEHNDVWDDEIIPEVLKD